MIILGGLGDCSTGGILSFGSGGEAFVSRRVEATLYAGTPEGGAAAPSEGLERCKSDVGSTYKL